jgi:hypothetical protein
MAEDPALDSRIAGSAPRTPDSPRWCDECERWGDHHTEGHIEVRVAVHDHFNIVIGQRFPADPEVPSLTRQILDAPAREPAIPAEDMPQARSSDWEGAEAGEPPSMRSARAHKAREAAKVEQFDAPLRRSRSSAPSGQSGQSNPRDAHPASPASDGHADETDTAESVQSDRSVTPAERNLLADLATTNRAIARYEAIEARSGSGYRGLSDLQKSVLADLHDQRRTFAAELRKVRGADDDEQAEVEALREAQQEIALRLRELGASFD